MHELPDCLLYAPVDLLLRPYLVRHLLTLQRLLTLDLLHAVQLAQGLADQGVVRVQVLAQRVQPVVETLVVAL